MKPVLVVALATPWIVAAFLAWLVFTLIRQHGQALLGQDELRERLASAERTLGELAARRTDAEAPAVGEGLPQGTQAPAFTLPDLEGRPRPLQDFLGHPLVMVFFDPGCGFCAEMAPRLRGLPRGGTGLLLVSRGDADEHRRLAAEHGWRCDVVLQSMWEVGAAYRANGTPTGYLVDTAGIIASQLAVGADAVLSLLEPGAGLKEKELAAVERARAAGLAARPANRQGLSPGTEAPGFTLPDTAGSKRSLGEFRGRRVLLVFSDPDCGPCDAMVPDLVRLHERTRDDNLEVVVVSRGDVGANRDKAERLGYPFPVLVQRRWEVSAKYNMFATPVAYLLDERGIVTSEVAVGADAILGLVP